VKAKTKKAKNIEKELAKQRQLYRKKVIEAERKKRPLHDTVLTVTNPKPEALFHPNGGMRKPVKSDYNKLLVERNSRSACQTSFLILSLGFWTGCS
jgi:hypothetical protein